MEKVSCFIRKNTPELRKRIEDLDIQLCCCASFNSSIWLDYDSEASLMVHGAPLYNEGNEEQNIACYLKNTEEWGTIDCGENEDLFLALIALREDSDKNQWFVSDNGRWYLNCGESLTHKELEHFINLECDIPQSNTHWHKATAQEIVEHFKIK